MADLKATYAGTTYHPSYKDPKAGPCSLFETLRMYIGGLEVAPIGGTEDSDSEDGANMDVSVAPDPNSSSEATQGGAEESTALVTLDPTNLWSPSRLFDGNDLAMFASGMLPTDPVILEALDAEQEQTLSEELPSSAELLSEGLVVIDQSNLYVPGEPWDGSERI